MKLNEAGEIIEPLLGDAELVRMEFDPSGAIIHFELWDDQRFVLKLQNIRWMSFDTNCAQNVIGKIIITNDTNAVNAPKDIRDLLLIRTLRIPGDTSKPDPLFVLKTEPLAGGELSCIADKIYEVGSDALP
jgi:hypothetical protein